MSDLSIKKKEQMTSQDLKIIAAVTAIAFVQGLQYGVSPVLSQISSHYSDISISLVQMLITAPSVVAMFLALCSGRLVTRFSKKKMLLLSALISGITGIVPLLADSFALLFVSRIVYGIALGFSTALNSAVVAEFFTGEKRVKAMGIQAASVGGGMVIITSLSGLMGVNGFQNSYWINLIGFISFVVIAIFLPETGTVKISEKNTIHLNKTVYTMAAFAFLEFFFLITFTTNISMHISTFGGDSGISGVMTGIFSVAQILIGILLRFFTKIMGRFTLPAAMLNFSVGAVFLVLFPQNLVMLALGSALCGISQGAFIPVAFVTASDAVNESSAAMASAVITFANCLGQLLSAPVLNSLAGELCGTPTTSDIYLIAAVGMAASAVACATWRRKMK